MLTYSFEGRMWDLIVSVPDHCLSFYLIYKSKVRYEHTTGASLVPIGIIYLLAQWPTHAI